VALRVVILGAGGHAKALRHVLPYTRVPVIKLIENDDEVRSSDQVYIGIGDQKKRRLLFEKFRDQIPNRGVQIMGNTWIGPDVRIGNNVLVNTGAQIDHDCSIEAHCVIAPGAILCGAVTLGEGCFIGAGAIIVQEVTLEPDTFVPAGTLVVGSDDFRKPIRMVRDRGADQVDLRQEGADLLVGA
ncbi:MAG: hypothetical protein ACR2RE_11100, partial [Geminicoccaceae bacterium]